MADHSHLFSFVVEMTDHATGQVHTQTLVNVNVPCPRPDRSLADYPSSDLAAELELRYAEWTDWIEQLEPTSEVED